MNLKKYSFAIVTHVYATGPSFNLEEYLSPQVKNLLFIGHPFSYTKDTRSFLRVYKNGKLVTEKHFVYWKGPELLFYLKDVLLTLWWTLRYGTTFDYFVGVDSLNAVTGLYLEFFGKVKHTVFYTIDYVPQRSGNSVLNFFYHRLDKISIEKGWRVWNLSQKMAEAREKNGISSKYRDKQLVVPVGTMPIARLLPEEKIDKYKVIFMGHLREGQGVELLVDSMKDVINKVPKAHLLIIGGGPLEESLKQKVKKLQLEKSVTFTGFVKNFSDVKKYMQDAAVAVAPYVDSEKTFTQYTDPGKPKDYLANGIPIVITKVPQVAFEIHERKCGIAISYSKKDLVNALISILSDQKKLQLFRKNALAMARDYTWDKIFVKTLQATIQ